MDFEVYCDENHPELFTSKKPTVEFLMIGSLWLPSALRNELKTKIRELRKQFGVWGEIKWTKISPSKIDFYKSLIDLFMCYGEQLRFRCIAVSNKDFDSRWHEDDNELGFYKFYYQLLHHWIFDFNQYRIFCDTKTNRDLERLDSLKDCLGSSNLSADIKNIQSLPSQEVVLIQLADLLLGAASARINDQLKEGSAKSQLIEYLEQLLGKRICPTYRSENKFNVFRINLQGGW